MAEQYGDLPVRVGLRVAMPVVGALVLAVLLRGLFPPDGMFRWVFHPATIAGCCWAGQLWYVGRSVDTTRIASTLFGLANGVTILRGGLYAVVAGFVVVPPSTGLAWVPAVCYGTGAVLDRLDGAMARTVGEQTELGTRLDMAFDTFGFGAAPLVAVLWGRLPVWYLSISAARYLFLAAIYWRRYRNRPVFDTPDSNLGKYLAGGQMGFITVALVPTVPVAAIWTVAPFVLAPSLLVFGRDFLAISGRLPEPFAGGQD
jgi:CDP-diacylglycerol--glycerol-3-phosphate 3-phosphatidyltransferase